MKKLVQGLLTRTFFVAVLVLLQVGLIVGLVVWLGARSSWVYLALIIVSVLIVLAMLDRDDINPSYRLMWIAIIVFLPPTGTLFYLFWGQRSVNCAAARRYKASAARGAEALGQDPALLRALGVRQGKLVRCAVYLSRHAAAPLYADTLCEYYPLGEAFLPPLLKELGRARRFIFMEYFIIEGGYMWDAILELLKAKAAAGLDVRVLYDAFGSMFTLPEDYANTLRAAGIKCVAFSPVRLSRHVGDYVMLNHRDHRKITVIDGNVAFTGGLNLADEYINRKKRFGVWKDTGLMLRGSGVYSMTVGFLTMWDYLTGSESDFAACAPTLRYASDGFVQPYFDSPLDTERVAENVYLNVLQQAQRYVYIVTPYLIVDNEMLTALRLAARGGVDVRLITPGVPDKWYAYWVTQSYYKTLLEAGVRIFQYTPGFIHAKMYVSDDEVAVVGSANMDYRSLYLHFENCCAFYGGHMVRDVKADLLAAMEAGREVSLADVAHTPLPKQLVQSFLRIFSPLM